MMPCEFHLHLHSRRDRVGARQRARQIGRLLGMPPAEQAGFAASVFELACQASLLTFRIHGNRLQVSSDAGHLERVIPSRLQTLAAEDLPWLVQELDQHTPLNLFEEYRQQNRELLAAMEMLHACRRELAQLRGTSEETAAA